MASVNSVTLIGHLGADPELRYTPSGQAVTNLRLATNRNYKDDSGEWQSIPEWHGITVWGEQAERAADQLRKGRLVYVEGRLQPRSYEKDGVKHYTYDIQASRVLGLDRRSEGDVVRTPNGEVVPVSSRRPVDDVAEAVAAATGGQVLDDDDIPF